MGWRSGVLGWVTCYELVCDVLLLPCILCKKDEGEAGWGSAWQQGRLKQL